MYAQRREKNAVFGSFFMTFNTVDDIQTAIGSREVAIRILHRIWAQRRPVPDPAGAPSGSLETTEAPQIDWLRSDIFLPYHFTERALEKEEFLLVCDAAREALRRWDELDEHGRTVLVKVRMNYAAALTRLGFTRDARSLLEPCILDDFRPALGKRLKGELFAPIGRHPSRGISSCLCAGRRATDGPGRTLFLRARPQDSSAATPRACTCRRHVFYSQ